MYTNQQRVLKVGFFSLKQKTSAYIDIKERRSSAADKPCLGADFEQGFETNPLCFILFRNFFIFISKNSNEIF